MKKEITRELLETPATRRDLVATLLGVAAGGAAISVMSGCVAQVADSAPQTDQVTEALTGTTNIYWVDTVASLRAFTGGAANWIAILQGYSAAGDGGGGVFVWSTTASVDDGGTFFNNVTPPITSAGWKRLFDGPFNVKWFGAKGDGSTDDRASIQAAINACAGSGSAGTTRCTVYLPAGIYMLGSAIVLPRTYYGASGENLNGLGAVHLVGDGKHATHMRGNGSFSSTALVEWTGAATGRARCANQRISGMTLRAANIDGKKCIWFKFDTSYSTDFTTQQFDGEFGDLVLEGNNSYHTVLIDLEGNIWQTWFHDLWGNTSLTGYNYTTVLVRFGRGTDDGNDGEGAFNCTFERVVAAKYNGGECALVEGRMVDSAIIASAVGNQVGRWVTGTRRPGIALYNSAGTVIEGTACEGSQNVNVVYFENCRSVVFRGGTVGCAVSSPAGSDSFNLVNSTNCTIADVPYWSANPSISAPGPTGCGIKRVVLGSGSLNTTIDLDIGSTDTIANAIQNNAGWPQKRIRTRRTDGNAEEAVKTLVLLPSEAVLPTGASFSDQDAKSIQLLVSTSGVVFPIRTFSFPPVGLNATGIRVLIGVNVNLRKTTGSSAIINLRLLKTDIRSGVTSQIGNTVGVADANPGYATYAISGITPTDCDCYARFTVRVNGSGTTGDEVLGCSVDYYDR